MKGRYILKKLLTSLVVLFIVITLNFFLPRMIFSDPAQPYYAGVADDERLKGLIREEYGFNKPVFVQYLLYLQRIFTLNFGDSYVYKAPVTEVMFSRIPWSLVLSLTGMIVSVGLGILFGAVASRRRGRWQDNALLRMSTLTTAIPTFWLALVLVMLLGFILPIFPYHGAMTAGYRLRFHATTFFIGIGVTAALTVALYLLFRKGLLLFLVPLCGFFLSVIVAIPVADTLDVLYHAALPLIVICFGGIIGYALSVRNSMIVTVNEDYILTARAKGLPERRILFRHAFRNGLLPLVTTLGMSLAGLFGGSVLIEKIFSWPGMGQLLLEANNTGDFLLAQGIMLFFSLITIICNFVVDLIYHKLDPRVGALR